MSFNDILEAVEKLPMSEQEDLVEILRRRQIARRREQLIRQVKAVRRQHKAGKSRPCTPAELMKELLS